MKVLQIILIFFLLFGFKEEEKQVSPPPSKKEVKKEEVKVKETKFERNQISPEEITKILESYTINNKANIDEESLSSVKEILNKLITVLLEKDIKEFTNMIEDPLPYDFESKFEKEELETKFLEFKEKPASKFKNLEETFRVQGEFVYYKEPEKELYKFLFLEGEIQLRKGGGDIMSYSTFPKAVRNSKLEMLVYNDCLITEKGCKENKRSIVIHVIAPEGVVQYQKDIQLSLKYINKATLVGIKFDIINNKIERIFHLAPQRLVGP